MLVYFNEFALGSPSTSRILYSYPADVIQTSHPPLFHILLLLSFLLPPPQLTKSPGTIKLSLMLIPLIQDLSPPLSFPALDQYQLLSFLSLSFSLSLYIYIHIFIACQLSFLGGAVFPPLLL